MGSRDSSGFHILPVVAGLLEKGVRGCGDTGSREGEKVTGCIRAGPVLHVVNIVGVRSSDAYTSLSTPPQATRVWAKTTASKGQKRRAVRQTNKGHRAKDPENEQGRSRLHPRHPERNANKQMKFFSSFSFFPFVSFRGTPHLAICPAEPFPPVPLPSSLLPLLPTPPPLPPLRVAPFRSWALLLPLRPESPPRRDVETEALLQPGAATSAHPVANDDEGEGQIEAESCSSSM